MLYLTLKGTKKIPVNERYDLTTEVKVLVSRTAELGLKPSEIEVFFSDDVSYGDHRPILWARVECLESPERTVSVLASLASGLGVLLKGKLPETKVNVFVATIPRLQVWESQ